MSVTYAAILWNKHKKLYDLILWSFIAGILLLFGALELSFHPNVTAETLIIRSTAFTAIVLLHFILIIGPMSRISYLFLPLLYNRRHLGVSMFILASVHGIFSIVNFHSLGNINPVASVFLSNQNYREISEFPFQILGFLALCILMLMAVTSHDFWLKNLSPKLWKGMHMMVYGAYALIVLHIALGTLQYEQDMVYQVLLISGFCVISGLHLYTGYLESQKIKRTKNTLTKEGYVFICLVGDIQENRARSVFVNRENIAVYKYDEKISAVNNICKHQMGPLGEGKIVEGCITCPWHGYQYQPHNGQSPPPYKEKIATYSVRLLGNEIWINPTPLDEGTAVEPARIVT